LGFEDFIKHHILISSEQTSGIDWRTVIERSEHQLPSPVKFAPSYYRFHYQRSGKPAPATAFSQVDDAQFV